MNNSLHDDQQISYQFESRSTEEFYSEDTHKVFDFFISCKDCEEYQKKDSLVDYTQPSTNFISDLDEVESIDGQIDLESDEDDFLMESSLQNNLSKKSLNQFLIRVPSIQKTSKIIEDEQFGEQKTTFNPFMEIEEMVSEKLYSKIAIDEQVSILFEEKTDDKPISQPNKSINAQKKKSQKKRTTKGIRKGKNLQSKTQKFLKYMTHYHFSKNFKQNFDKGIKNHGFDPQQYKEYPVEKKIEILDLIMKKEAQEYEMKIHYSVQKGKFMERFKEKQSYITDFFHQVVRRVYTLMFETCKRRILYPEDLESSQGYLDRQGEKQFENVFDEILLNRSQYGQFVACDFESRLWKEIED